jgi:hypothetical protein
MSSIMQQKKEANSLLFYNLKLCVSTNTDYCVVSVLAC